MLEVYEETHSDDHSSPAVPLQGGWIGLNLDGASVEGLEAVRGRVYE